MCKALSSGQSEGWGTGALRYRRMGNGEGWWNEAVLFLNYSLAKLLFLGFIFISTWLLYIMITLTIERWYMCITHLNSFYIPFYPSPIVWSPSFLTKIFFPVSFYLLYFSLIYSGTSVHAVTVLWFGGRWPCLCGEDGRGCVCYLMWSLWK